MAESSSSGAVCWTTARAYVVAVGIALFWGADSFRPTASQSGVWARNFAYADVVFTLVSLATSEVNQAREEIGAGTSSAQATTHKALLTVMCWLPDVVAAYKSLRSAAGVFSFAQSIVKANASKLSAYGKNTPPELQPEVLAGMVDLCLAQAQQCMLWQAEKGGKKPKMLAMLAKGLGQCYRKAVDHFRGGLVCGTVSIARLSIHMPTIALQGPQMSARIMETMGAMSDVSDALWCVTPARGPRRGSHLTCVCMRACACVCVCVCVCACVRAQPQVHVLPPH